jgi:iron complex transport system substrate-binding protein
MMHEARIVRDNIIHGLIWNYEDLDDRDAMRSRFLRRGRPRPMSLRAARGKPHPDVARNSFRCPGRWERRAIIPGLPDRTAMPGIKFDRAFFMFCLVLLLAACGPAPDEKSQGAPSGPSRISLPPGKSDSSMHPTRADGGIMDALGRRLSFQEPPRRIVLPGRAVFITVDAAYMFPGAGKRIVAMRRSDQDADRFIALVDPDAAAKAVLTEESGPEQIAGFKPDVVILKSYLARSVGNPIEALGIPVVYVDFETPEQYFRDLNTLGELFGQPGRAAEIIEYYRVAVRRVQDRLRGVSARDKRRVLLLYYSDRDGKVAFGVPPVSWMQTRMTEMAGGTPVWRDAVPGQGWTTVSLEQILAWDPDAVFVVSYWRDPKDVARGLQADPIWNRLRAVKERRLYAFAGDLCSWDQPSPRWILGLAWMAKKLYPERFEAVDITAVAADFYRVAYGFDSTLFREKIRSAFRGDLP